MDKGEVESNEHNTHEPVWSRYGKKIEAKVRMNFKTTLLRLKMNTTTVLEFLYTPLPDWVGVPIFVGTLAICLVVGLWNQPSKEEEKNIPCLHQIDDFITNQNLLHVSVFYDKEGDENSYNIWLDARNFESAKESRERILNQFPEVVDYFRWDEFSDTEENE